jgi:hypothetical protein
VQDEGISLKDAAGEGLFLDFHVCFLVYCSTTHTTRLLSCRVPIFWFGLSLDVVLPVLVQTKHSSYGLGSFEMCL